MDDEILKYRMCVYLYIYIYIVNKSVYIILLSYLNIIDIFYLYDIYIYMSFSLLIDFPKIKDSILLMVQNSG